MARFRTSQQRVASDKLHCEIRLRPKAVIRSASFMGLGNASVLQPAERLGLLLESPQQFEASKTRFDNLKRHSAAGMFLLGLIYGAHGSFAEQPENPISTDSEGQNRL